MDLKTIIFETNNFLEAERLLQEEVENARIKSSMGQELQSRRRLFTQREPNDAMILTAAFLDAEICAAEDYETTRQNWLQQRQFKEQIEAREKLVEQRNDYNSNKLIKDQNFLINENDEILLAGQGGGYEHLKRFNGIQDKISNSDSRDSSTPAKQDPMQQQRRNTIDKNEPRQTIQQLAQLVMNSARWRNAATDPNNGIHRKDLNLRPNIGNNNIFDSIFLIIINYN